MADNSTQIGTDTIRDIDRAAVKTQVFVIDQGGAVAESLVSLASPQRAAIHDGTTAAAIKAASTAPATTDGAMVVALSPNNVNLTGSGFLKVSDEPRQVFYDSFDTTMDTTNTWTSTQGSSGSAATIASGVLSIGTGTAANGYSKLTSQPTFKLVIPGWLVHSDAIALPDGAAPTANSYRYWGAGTTPAVPTVAAPITDGYGFELNTDGKMRAVVYAGGVQTVIQDLSATGNSKQPLNASYHRYIIQIRTDKTFFYIDSINDAGLVATTSFQSPQVQTLPKLFLCIGNATPPVSNTQIQCTGSVISDTGKNATYIADASYPWRRATVKPASTASVAADTALVVSLHPNSGNVASSAPLLGNELGLVVRDPGVARLDRLIEINGMILAILQAMNLQMGVMTDTFISPADMSNDSIN